MQLITICGDESGLKMAADNKDAAAIDDDVPVVDYKDWVSSWGYFIFLFFRFHWKS
jgi:hypothetical protein